MRDQKCEAVRVLGGNTNWEDFYWPQDVRTLDERVREMLQRLNLMEYEAFFKKQELSLIDIAKLDHYALDSIGIKMVKHRTAIIEYLSGKQKHYMELFSSNLSKYFIRGAADWRRGEVRGRFNLGRHHSIRGAKN